MTYINNMATTYYSHHNERGFISFIEDHFSKKNELKIVGKLDILNGNIENKFVKNNFTSG